MLRAKRTPCKPTLNSQPFYPALSPNTGPFIQLTFNCGYLEKKNLFFVSDLFIRFVLKLINYIQLTGVVLSWREQVKIC